MNMIKIKSFSPFFAIFIFIFGCTTTPKNPQWVINEVMIVNDSNYMDNFGKRSAWIEIYNNTAKTQDLGGRYLTNDRNNPKKYPIPRGDVLTQIKPHQHAIFWADNEPFNGTFHLNFSLDSGKENYIALYENDGKTLLDEIVIPADIPANKTFGYPMDGVKYDENGNSLATILERITPSSNNQIIEDNPKVTSLKENDKWGIMITITCMLVVFIGLILLYLIFKLIGEISKKMSQKRVVETGKLSAVRSESELSGETLAAISAAIAELIEDQHDIESTILTFQQVRKNYSPWSSKIYTLRQQPK